MKNAKNVAFMGVMSALMFVAMFLETYVFTFLIPLAPPCVLSLSLAITFSVCGEKMYMFFGGTIMGVCSLVIAFMIGNPVFILPWISILPRFFIGIVAYYICKLFFRICTKSNNRIVKCYLPYSLGAIFGGLTNTVLVLAIMFVCKFIGLEEIVATFIAINFPIEIVGSAILVPIFCTAISHYKRRA